MVFNKMAFLFVFFISVTACADPRYALPGSDDGGNQKKLETCQAKFSSNHCVSYVWEKTPTETDFGTFLFKIFKQNPVDGSSILEDLSGGVLTVVLWMPSMGHGSSPVTVARLGVGLYRASNVFFTMRGEWEIRFQLKAGNAVQDQAIIPINL